jgi:hypothetical protein
VTPVLANNAGRRIDSFTSLYLAPLGPVGSTAVTDSSYGPPKAVTNTGGVTVAGRGTMSFGGANYLGVDALIGTVLPTLYTVDWWQNMPGFGAYQAVYSSGMNSFEFFSGLGDGRFQLYQTDGVSPETLNSLNVAGVANVWQHVAVVRDGPSIKLYVDGALRDAWTSAKGAFTLTACAFYLGARGRVPGYYLTGRIGFFRYSPGIARWTHNFTPPNKPS